MVRYLGCLLAVAASFVSGLTAGPTEGAIFTGLGQLPGSPILHSIGLGVSDNGTVVGYGYNSSGHEEAFYWTSGGLTSLGFLSGDIYSNAIGITPDGSTIVGYSAASGSSQAFRWTTGDGMQGLGGLSGEFSIAYGVSADGSVIVGDSSVLPLLSGNTEAFSWASGNMTGLGYLPGGANNSYANGVSADGSVVVGRSKDGSGYQAFRYTGGVMTGLGHLSGGQSSAAEGLSADGSVVVGASDTPVNIGEIDDPIYNFYFRAFRWTQGTGMVSLGDLPGGTPTSYAHAVSGDGSIIVGYGETNNGSEAFIWDSINQMRLLQDVLVNDYGLDLSGWSKLGSANSISADGLKITGYGTHNGNTEAFFVDLSPAAVPEPSSLALVAIVAGGGAWRRFRRRSSTQPVAAA